ncbi:MAG: DUF1804 family protein, partial [Lentilitoribacter sp.]
SGKIETEPTYADVAREFHVSYDQARNACIGRTTAKKGKDSAKRSHSRRPTANTVENEARSIFELYEHEYKATLLQMQKDKNLSVNERVKLLTTLADGKAKMQRVEIEHHLKRADANVVSRLVRLFQPDATDTDVVKYYKEAAEMLRIEESSK